MFHAGKIFTNILILAALFALTNPAQPLAAQADDPITIIKGKNEGLFCGFEVGDYEHICVKIDGIEYWILGSSQNESEAEALYNETYPKGTPVTFTFDVRDVPCYESVESTTPSPDGKREVIVIMTSIKPIKR